jgi:hypothetical protein
LTWFHPPAFPCSRWVLFRTGPPAQIAV